LFYLAFVEINTGPKHGVTIVDLLGMTNVKRLVVPVEMVLGLLLGLVLGFWNIISCTEACINPGISGFQYILKSFLGRVTLACAML